MADESQRDACRTKDNYDTEEEAEEAADRLEFEFHKPLRSYQCEWCNLWHLTSKVD